MISQGGFVSLLEKICSSIKFKRDSNYIIKRNSQLNETLETFQSQVQNITNQRDDGVNYIFINECSSLELECRFSIETIKGKLKYLKPNNEKETKIKDEIITAFEASKKKYISICVEFNNNSLVSELKAEAN